jgi:hypothetical protein
MPDYTAIANPFIYGRILHPGRPFCPRPELEAALQQAADSCQRVVLLGERRMGKSSLVEHTLGHSGRLLVSVDLRGLDSVGDFIDRLLLRLSTALEAQRPLFKHLPRALKEGLSHVSELRISLGGGLLEFQTGAKVKASTVMQAMNALQRIGEWRRLVVFFDEFQEIAENLEAQASRHLLGVLRSEIQRQDKAAYIFAGSARDSMLELFTAEGSHFYQSALILEVGPIPRADMSRFLTEQFATGGRKLTAEAERAVFALAGDSPNDVQQFAYHIWAQSKPGVIDAPALRTAFATLMGEVGRRGELLLDAATAAQRRALLAIAARENEEFARDAFYRFAGFTRHTSLAAAMKPFLQGSNAILEKRGSRVRYRERFMRVWMLLQILRNPSMFPAARGLELTEEQASLQPYLAAALSEG